MPLWLADLIWCALFVGGALLLFAAWWLCLELRHLRSCRERQSDESAPTTE